MSKNCPLCGSDHLEDADVCECGYRFASAGPASSEDAIAARTAPAAPQANLTISGWLMSLGGVAIAIYAFAFFDPTVDGYVSGDYSSVGARINNTGLLQDQLMLFMAGCSMLIGGVVMLSAGALIEAKSRS